MKVIRTEENVTTAASDHFSETTWHQRGAEEVPEPDAFRPSLVHFPPGVHTHWHRHASGQVLFIVNGRARVGIRRDADEAAPTSSGTPERHELSPGDLVIAAPGEWHWHGAAPNSFMAHLSVIREDTTWGEAVAGEDYEG
jgi:quercetin dioxygenase-like cupin family protein